MQKYTSATPEHSQSNIAETVRDLAQRGGEFKNIDVNVDGVSFPLVGRLSGDRMEIVDIHAEAQKWRKQPVRRTGSAKVFTLDSFKDLTNRHADDDSAIFARVDDTAPSLTAVVDYHRKNSEPRFCNHRILYAFPLSKQWKLWREQDGKPMAQLDFAHFIEDNIVDLSMLNDADEIAPGMASYVFAAPVEVLGLSRGLEIHESARVKNIENLQSGAAQIAFEEEHRDAHGAPLRVPGAFVVSIPLFEGGAPVRIQARLRYRKAGGALVWFYQLYRPEDKIIETVRTAALEAAETTGLPLYEGEPEAGGR